jgi:hypothetical protein
VGVSVTVSVNYPTKFIFAFRNPQSINRSEIIRFVFTP